LSLWLQSCFARPSLAVRLLRRRIFYLLGSIVVVSSLASFGPAWAGIPAVTSTEPCCMLHIKIIVVDHVTDKEKTNFVVLPSTTYVPRYFDGERLPWPHLLRRDYEKAPACRIIFWNLRQSFKDTKAPGHTLHQSCRLPVARPSTSKVCAAPIVSASA
jgi:hypothetical protein